MKNKYLIPLILSSFILKAQDSHYWSNQFGAKSSLLCGAVVGGVRDISAAYYNPGALGFVDSITVSVNSDLYKVENLKVKNALGDGNDMSYYDYGISPQMISGLFKIDKRNKFKFGLILLTKTNSNINFNERVTGENEIFAPNEKIPFVSAFEYQNNVLDQWGGASLSYKINKHISIGTTLFLSYKNVNYRYFRYSRAIAVFPDSVVSSQTDYQAVSFRTCRFISKTGIAFDFHPLKFGVSFTSQSFGDFLPGDLLGGSSVQRELSGVNFEDFADELYIEKQDKLPVKQIQPWSIAAGISYSFAKFHLFATAEYFGAIPTYINITPESKEVSLKPQFSKDSKDFLTVYSKSNAILNYAIGAEWEATKKVHILSGFSRDNSFSSDFLSQTSESYNEPIYMPFSYWNLNNLSLGLNFKRKNNQFTLGGVYTFSDNTQHRNWINYNDPNGILLSSPVQNNASTNYQAINIVVGYIQYIE
ncbi:MAG: hypothetical protein SFY32_17350 [Bacteroidota bacterium]|nr:hypothetical protein [Bacteroidota bacterium]